MRIGFLFWLYLLCSTSAALAQDAAFIEATERHSHFRIGRDDAGSYVYDVDTLWKAHVRIAPRTTMTIGSTDMRVFACFGERHDNSESVAFSLVEIDRARAEVVRTFPLYGRICSVRESADHREVRVGYGTPEHPIFWRSSDTTPPHSEISSVVARDGSVVALVGRTTVWDFPLTVPERNTQIVVEDGDRFRVDPNEPRRSLDVYACVDKRLYRIARETGRVQARDALSARCVALEAQWQDATLREGITAVTQWPDGQRERHFVNRTRDLLDSQWAPTDAATWVALEQQALRADPTEACARAEQDPTNPWWVVRCPLQTQQQATLDPLARTRRGRTFDEINDVEALRRLFSTRETRTTPAADDFEYGLSLIGVTHERAVPDWFVQSLRVLPSSSPGLSRDHDRLMAMGDRLLALAPQAPGAWEFFRVMSMTKPMDSTVAYENGRLYMRDVEAVRPRVPWMARTRFIACHAADAAFAFAWAILVVVLMKMLRGVFALPQRVGTYARFSPFARWTHGERIGLWLACVAVIALAACAAHHIALLGALSREPAAHALKAVPNPLTVMEEIGRIDGWLRWRVSANAAALALVSLLALSLLAPRRRMYETGERSRVGGAIAWLVPGASEHYGAFGFLFAGLFATWFMGQLVFACSDGTSLTTLDTMITPTFESIEQSSYFPDALFDPALSYYRAGWGLLLAHILWMLGQKRRLKRAVAPVDP